MGLLWGPLPRAVQQARLAASLLWLVAYFLNLVQQLPRGRRSIGYANVDGAPWEEPWGPYRALVKRQGLFLRLTHEAEALMLPPWLDDADRRELAGRIAARVKHAHADQVPQA